MRFAIYGATLIALAGTTGVALAAGPVTLDTSQKNIIKKDLASASAQTTPATYVADVGSKVPSSIKLHAIPHRVATKVSAIKGDRFAKLDNGDLLIVKHSNRDVVAMLESSSSMGRSAAEGGASTQPSGSMKSSTDSPTMGASSKGAGATSK